MPDDTKVKFPEDLTGKTVGLTDALLADDGSESYNALVSAVAKTIVEQYAGSQLGGALRSIKSAIDLLNSNWADIQQESLTYTDSSGNTITFYFRYWKNILSVITNATQSMVIPNNWVPIGSLQNIKPQSDRYIPLVCPGGGVVVVRIYPDGGVRIYGNQNSSIWLQTSGSVLFK